MVPGTAPWGKQRKMMISKSESGGRTGEVKKQNNEKRPLFFNKNQKLLTAAT